MKWKSRPKTASHGDVYKRVQFAWKPVQCADRKVWLERYMCVYVFHNVSGLVAMLTGLENGWIVHGSFARDTDDFKKWQAETRTTMGEIQNGPCECDECKKKRAVEKVESRDGNLITLKPEGAK